MFIGILLIFSLCIFPSTAVKIELGKNYDFILGETTMSCELLITEAELPLMKDYLIVDVNANSYFMPSFLVYTVIFYYQIEQEKHYLYF